MGRLMKLVEQWETKHERQAAIANVVATLCDQADPKARLRSLLDVWVVMDEAAWSAANVEALYNDILDIFAACPEAGAWFQEWRRREQPR